MDREAVPERQCGLGSLGPHIAAQGLHKYKCSPFLNNLPLFFLFPVLSRTIGIGNIRTKEEHGRTSRSCAMWNQMLWSVSFLVQGISWWLCFSLTPLASSQCPCLVPLLWTGKQPQSFLISMLATPDLDREAAPELCQRGLGCPGAPTAAKDPAQARGCRVDEAAWSADGCCQHVCGVSGGEIELGNEVVRRICWSVATLFLPVFICRLGEARNAVLGSCKGVEPHIFSVCFQDRNGGCMVGRLLAAFPLNQNPGRCTPMLGISPLFLPLLNIHPPFRAHRSRLTQIILSRRLRLIQLVLSPFLPQAAGTAPI